MKMPHYANGFIRQAVFVIAIMTMTACSEDKSITLPGYIEGKYSYISANYSGVLKTLDVKKGDEVKAGQLLFALVPEPEYDDLVAEQNRVAQALAQVQQDQADYELQKLLLQRRVQLRQQKFASQEELDTVTAKANEALDALNAQKKSLMAAEADLRKATWEAKQKVLYAPVTGLIFDTYYNPGELVERATPVLALLDPLQVKIYFFSTEKLLGKFKLNQIIDVTCDSCESAVQGKIVYISPEAEYTPPVIYSNEEREKLVYRIEAQPLITKAYYSLHPGQPITVHVKFNK